MFQREKISAEGGKKFHLWVKIHGFLFGVSASTARRKKNVDNDLVYQNMRLIGKLFTGLERQTVVVLEQVGGLEVKHSVEIPTSQHLAQPG